jgi:hypothetical protein
MRLLDNRSGRADPRAARSGKARSAALVVVVVVVVVVAGMERGARAVVGIARRRWAAVG